MPPFKFRWQVLLTLRERERDERRQDLASACARLRTLEQRRDALAAERTTQQDERRRELASGAISVQILRRFAEFEAHCRRQLVAAEQALEQALAEAESCRQQLAEADRQIRVLEKLRERRQAEHAAQAARSETRTLDEVGGRLYYRAAG